tara:strand:+ start:9914 stop:10165 length:252 start_codon:yes stop_codon:yes gene_type:complete
MGRKRKGATPSYRLHRASGNAVVTVDGRDHYLGKYDTPESLEKYARLIAERAVTGEVTTDRDPDDGAITVVEVLAKFWAHAEK